MSSIQNLNSFDPFADATKGDDLLPAGTEDYIHIRIQQRNGRKTLTTVQGIADDYDKKKLVKAFKKKFACNGTVIEHPEYGEVIQLQGDQRKNICQFLMEVTFLFVKHNLLVTDIQPKLYTTFFLFSFRLALSRKNN
ncbi:hypothetical protein XELAEV_18033217mg [Xenopus laevis]|uniref:SUI1 domain-containing protein n=1 Tax=Xenopus laevis TaxID=8355 RepID=A0A974CJ70_XENLA|nr:hypothetical protein XELAEV_18033217mg [Xenopus laevis]